MIDDKLLLYLIQNKATGSQLLDMLNNPEWDKAERVHDWRNHVPQLLKELWSGLNLSVKVSVYATAEQAAFNEHWD